MSKSIGDDKKPHSTKALAIALWTLSVLYFLAVVFLSVVCNADDLGVGIGSVDSAYGTVLADIPGIKEADPRIVDIAMLGSHDAVTSEMSMSSPMDYHDRDTVLGRLEPMSAGFQYRFGVTQRVNLYQQLMQGSRFLHIKYTNFEGEWYGTHAHITAKISEYVIQVLGFLAAHPGEILFLLFQPMYFGDKTYSDFHEWLSTVSLDGKTMCDYVNYGDADVMNKGEGGARISELRYNDVTANGEKAGLVLLDRREDGIYKPEHDNGDSVYDTKFFDMDANAEHTWHSRSCSDILIEKIGETADKILASPEEYGNLLRVNQTQAAFSGSSFKDVMCDIFSWSLLKIAENHNVKVLEHKDFDKLLSAMPVLQVDFVNSDAKDFNARANAKIRAYNEALCGDTQ